MLESLQWLRRESGFAAADDELFDAVAEAVKLWGDEPLRVLSIGCGVSKSKFPAAKLKNAGILPVGAETMGLLFDANDELPDYLLKQFMASGYFRAQPKPLHTLTIDGAGPQDLFNLQYEARRFLFDSEATLRAFMAYSR